MHNLLLVTHFFFFLFLKHSATNPINKLSISISRIVGGIPAVQDEFPYMVMLTRSNGYLFCAGVLIGDYYVLTAAHCLINKTASSVVARLGDYDWTTQQDATHVSIAVDTLTIHPQFKYATAFHDLAIIQLASPAPRSHQIHPICLPPPSTSFIGQKAVISGWGSQTPDGFAVKFLHKLEMKILSEKECKQLLGGFRFFWRPEKICAWERNKDSCKGDSGGPLMWEDDAKKRYLIGIVSLGFCGEGNRPGLFIRVSSYLDWIRNNTRDDHTICWS